MYVPLRYQVPKNNHTTAMSESDKSGKRSEMRIVFGVPGLSAHNLMFDKSYPMRAGIFPKDHPFAFCAEPFTFVNSPAPDVKDSLNDFRNQGYFASCFPEGDGITIKCLNNQTNEQLRMDIENYLIKQQS